MVFGQENIIEKLMIGSTQMSLSLCTLEAYSLGITTVVRKSRGGLHEQLERWPGSRKYGTAAHGQNSAL